jgi:hypothetical protein
MGLCVPKECEKDSLTLLNKIYRQGMILTGVIKDPSEPIFTFPQVEYDNVAPSMTFGYVAMFLLIALFVFLSILGFVVEHYSLGDKKLHNSMVEAVEEEHPEAPSIETKKERWALIIYCFSITRNF